MKLEADDDLQTMFKVFHHYTSLNCIELYATLEDVQHFPPQPQLTI